MYFQFQYSQSENPLNILRYTTGCNHQSMYVVAACVTKIARNCSANIK